MEMGARRICYLLAYVDAEDIMKCPDNFFWINKTSINIDPNWSYLSSMTFLEESSINSKYYSEV